MSDGTANNARESHPYTRREFLQMMFGGAVGICIGSPIAAGLLRYYLSAGPLPKQTDTPTPLIPTTEFPPDLVFTDKYHEYDDKAAEIIERVKKDFDVTIVSPTTWGESGKEQTNLPWRTRDIAYVAQAISQLPPAYWHDSRSPREILLLRMPGSSSEGVGGGYANRRMILYTSETFDPETQFRANESRRMYTTQGNHLRAAVCHEWTHSFMEGNPNIFADFVKQAGWEQIVGKNEWKNLYPKNLIHDCEADVYPSEDVAVSAGLMLVNPDFISQDRRNFFLTEPSYSNWPTVTDYRNHHP
ncbi:hypothetical protein A2Z00_00105 [Candidatus Gottesmanbacteria bacterium RBG_13_45_10]|uniref:Uncharacterized protein n=1 Tax=Candidatus Gottesmanbacteria bacterium RBG_13_45_10 TaxID=1798370 RepID=A0A1F5ZHN2_9BACT|nr:MAG: hypothetical protein A2Z00_00105 [Candidatus Gottesmanbacteria bacterium RBG_13_45_10]